MDSLHQLRAVVCLMALMGLTWIFGAFTVNGVGGLIFHYLFAVLNVLQVFNVQFPHHYNQYRESPIISPSIIGANF